MTGATRCGTLGCATLATELAMAAVSWDLRCTPLRGDRHVNIRRGHDLGMGVEDVGDAAHGEDVRTGDGGRGSFGSQLVSGSIDCSQGGMRGWDLETIDLQHTLPTDKSRASVCLADG